MNRRGFLVGMLATGAAPFVVRAESLMPVVKVASDAEVLTYSGNLSIEQITQEALRTLHKQMGFLETINRDFDAQVGDRIVIRVPYRAAA